MEDYTPNGLVRSHLGALLYLLRRRKKLSQNELAELTGVSQGEISKIERCQVIPSVETVVLLSVVFPSSARRLVRAREDAIVARDLGKVQGLSARAYKS